MAHVKVLIFIFIRKASFIDQFNEEEQKSQNIRFFFPDGCKSEFVLASGTEKSKITVPPSIYTKAYSNTRSTLIEPTTEKNPPLVKLKTPEPSVIISSSNQYSELTMVESTTRRIPVTVQNLKPPATISTNNPSIKTTLTESSAKSTASGYFYPVPENPLFSK